MKLRKTFSIIAFVTVFVILAAAIVVDVVVFAEAIMTFLGAILVTVAFFILCILGLIVSCFLGFGFILLDKYGFWPATATTNVFKEAIAEIHVAPESVAIFRVARIIILILCVIALIFAIIALTRDKTTRKAPLKPMSIIALVFASLGILAAGAVFIIIPLIP